MQTIEHNCTDPVVIQNCIELPKDQSYEWRSIEQIKW